MKIDREWNEAVTTATAKTIEWECERLRGTEAGRLVDALKRCGWRLGVQLPIATAADPRPRLRLVACDAGETGWTVVTDCANEGPALTVVALMHQSCPEVFAALESLVEDGEGPKQ